MTAQIGTKPLPKANRIYCQLDPKEDILSNHIWNAKNFIQENVFENVICEVVGFLFWPKWVSLLFWLHKGRIW